MHGKLASFLGRNVIQAVIGAVLIIVTGSAVAFAASGGQLPFTTPGARAHTGASTQTTAKGDDKSQHETQSSNQAKDDNVEGTVLSVDTTSSTFSMSVEDGSTLQVSVNAQTHL